MVVLLTALGRTQTHPATGESQVQAATKEDSRGGAVAGQPGGGSSQVQPGRLPVHIVPYGPATPATKQSGPIGKSSNSGRVQYWGGPVISNVQVVEVLWGNFVDVPSTTGLEQFFTDVTQSNYLGLLAEYSPTGLTGLGGAPGTNQTIGLGTFLGPRITITPSMCPGSATNTLCTVNDAEIQTELNNQLNAHHLPTPVQDGQGNFNTIYMVYFPPGVTIVLQPGTNSCQQFGFCAYHSSVDQLSAPKFLYGVFPDFGPTSGCSAAAGGCGAGTSQQNLSSASSHELAEAITDAQVGSFPSNATVPAPPLAWIDQNSGEEIGDFCNQDHAQITVNSNTYTVQTEWSNMQGGCVSAPAHFQITVPATIIPGRPFNMTVIAENSINNAQLSNYNDTAHFTSSDTSGVIPADYTFTPGDVGVHNFSITLNTVGSQTVSAVDTRVPGMTGVGTIDVEHNPDLGVAIGNNPASFKQGETGDTYTIIVTNGGDKATDGSTVTVTDSISGGLTVTAVAGTGWSCTVQAQPICTRSDALAASASYPAITVTVNVSVTAPSQVTSNVLVSGGGEVNTTNDTAMNVTNIVQFADLVISKFHAGVFAQGQTGQTYTINVSNIGPVFSTGTVTVTDTLPTGLTATAISGTGWSCSTPPTLTCTRSDQLGSFNQSYPPITLTVNVDANAPMPTVTNVATVSGGGEVNTGNDSANDVTTITAAAPDMIVSSTHSGNFQQGQIGAVYTITASNVGSLASSGTVTVNDVLPFAGFTATAITGTGWSCTLSTLTCTRSDVLANAASYPPITLTVNVSVTAGTGLSNTVFVSGGGELNTANDTGTDVTTVTQFANLTISKFHGGPFAQGQTGAMYFLSVGNNAFAPTVGTVTVTDNLPAGLTATAISGSGWNCTLSNLTCTRSDVIGNGFYPQITVTVNVALNAPSSVTNTATVSGGGEIITNDDTASDPTSINPPLTMPSNLGAQNVAAGGSVTFSFGITSTQPGTVNLTCSSGVPPGAKCTFAPPSGGQGFTSVFLTISTTGPTASKFAASGYSQKPPLGALLLTGFAVAAFVMVRRSGRNVRIRLAITAAGAILLLIGCGGGSGPPPPPPPVVTPPGTYTITVTATNATTPSATASATATLVVH